MDKVRLGIIGFGNIGTAHAGHFANNRIPNMELTAICDISENRRNAARGFFPDMPIFDNADDLMKS